MRGWGDTDRAQRLQPGVATVLLGALALFTLSIYLPKPVVAQLPADLRQLEEEFDWLPGETLAWSCIRQGLEVDLYRVRCVQPRRSSRPRIHSDLLCKDDYEKYDEAENPFRRIRSKFLIDILSRPKLTAQIRPIGVRIANATYCDGLKLENIHTTVNLVLDKSYFDGRVSFQNFRTTKNLSLDDVNIVQTLNLRRTQIDGSLFMVGSTIGSMVSRDLVVGSSLIVRRSFVFLYFNLARARVRGRLDLSESKLTYLTMKHATVGADAALLETEVRCGTTLVGNTVEGDLALDRMVFSQRRDGIFQWDLDGAKWSGWVHRLPAQERESIVTYVRKKMIHKGEGNWKYGSCQLRDGRPLYGYLKLNEQRIRGTFCLRHIYGDAFVEEKRERWAGNARFQVTLNGIRTDGAMVLNWSERRADGSVVRDGENAIWQLIGLETRSIVSELDAWPEVFQFHDVSFKRLINGRSSCELEVETTVSPLGSDGLADGNTVLFRPPSDDDLVAWLGRNRVRSAQSYGQVINVLENVGRDATEIKVALAQVRLKELIERAPAFRWPDVKAWWTPSNDGTNGGEGTGTNRSPQHGPMSSGNFRRVMDSSSRVLADAQDMTRYLWTWSRIQLLRAYGTLIDFGHRPLKIVSWIVGTVAFFLVVLAWREGGKAYRVRTGPNQSEFLRPGLFYAGGHVRALHQAA